jgi:hypothetical protein
MQSIGFTVITFLIPKAKIQLLSIDAEAGFALKIFILGANLTLELNHFKKLQILYQYYKINNYCMIKG